MSEENVAIVHELLDAFRRGDGERQYEILSPNVILDPRGFADSSKLAIPGLTTHVYYGHQGNLDFWRGWLDAWEEIEWTVTESLDAGDRVVIGFDQRNKGRGSGIWVDFGAWWGIYEVREGLVVRYTTYLDRDAALRDAGLEREP